MPKARELPQPFYETHGFTDREGGLIFATLRRIAYEDEATLHANAKVADCRLTVRNDHAYLIRNGVEYFLHPKRLVFEDKDLVQTTATAEQIKDRGVKKRMEKAIPVVAQIKPDPLLESVSDEQLVILDQVHSRYQSMVYLGSGQEGIDQAILAQDRANFPQMLRRGKNGLPVYRDSDCAIFMAKVSGLPKELCSYWIRYEFLNEHRMSVEEYAS
mgnify:FL=1